MGRWGRNPARDGRGRSGLHTGTAGLLALLLLAAACGDDSSDAGTGTGDAAAETTGTTELPSCEDRQSLVVFHINGVLTPDRSEFNAWLENADHVMASRTGAVELVQAYHELGFHIVYVTRAGSDLDMHGVPYDEAMENWLDSEGFPLDERAYLHDEADAASLSDELADATGSGGGAYAAYTNTAGDVPPLTVAGVPEERIYSLGELSGEDGTTPVPGGDMSEHMGIVGELDSVCRTG